MKRATRRKLDRVWMTLGAVVLGAGAAIGAAAGDTERIGDYWMHAALASDGSAEVVEVIDYDFGSSARRGILRDIPDVDPEAPIEVSSPTAPDVLRVTSTFDGVALRIGNPNETVRGRHRYRIAYPIDSLMQSSDRLSWNAVGLDWTVGIDNVTAHLTTPHELTELGCDQGSRGSVGGCSVVQLEPGHLVVNASGLGAGEALTISATRRAPLDAMPAAPPEPSGPATDPGTGWLQPGLVSAGAGLLAAGAVSLRVRAKGRELVWKGGAADAAFGPRDGETVAVRSLDHGELAEMATIEFESPRGLSASAGGIVHAESVHSRHQIAWLIECAIRDEVVIDQPGGTVKGSAKDMVLRRGPAEPHHAVRETLDMIFAKGSTVQLGKYDKEFAEAWKHLGDDLDSWRESSGLWDPAGHRRAGKYRLWGVVGLLVGLAVAVVGGIVANRAGPEWLWITALGGLLGGGGFAAMIRAWELPIRTPEGSARWLQVESFRRFIANSEARHAESAAQRGLLRHYTAWAVALDELDHWESAVEAAAAVPGSAATSSSDFAFVAMAPAISSATTSTFTAPSSSGGGGGGGGAGGGGGGGGGGSW